MENADAVRWFDAHLDLAYLRVGGRDMLSRPREASPTSHPASITLPSLREGRVTSVLATLFTEPDGEGPCGYPGGDAEKAREAALRQLDVYRGWEEEGLVHRFGKTGGPGSIALGVLMECADPVRSPDDLRFWKENGLVAIGLAWHKASRYAGGNGTGGGLTAPGRELVRAMDEIGIVHDLSHLSQRGADELLAATDRPVIASHSNCRALIDGRNERHLSDEVIAEIGRRGGVIGINLITPFLVDHPGYLDRAPSPALPRAPLESVVRHIERICELHGHRRGIGLGTDADGGVTAWVLPRGIDRPADYEKIARALLGRGWSREEVDDFRFGNWARFFGLDRA